MKKFTKIIIAVVMALTILVPATISPLAASAPKKVAELRIIDRDDDELELKWKKQKSADGYRVYMRHGGGKWILKRTTSKTTAEFDNLRSANVYSFKVRAYINTKSGKKYGKYSSVLKTATEPKEVKNLSASKIKKGKTTLKWSAVKGADKYQVYKYYKSDRAWKKVKTTTGRSVSLKASNGNQFKVRALVVCNKKNIYGDFSNKVEVGVSLIGYSKAKSIALKNAGLKASQVRDYEASLEKTSSGYIYEIDFEYKNRDYEYEINAKNGKILHKEID